MSYSETIRSLAVELVDAKHGYTCEFAASPEAHREEYDTLETHLARQSPGHYLEVGIELGTYSLGSDGFTIPRCESRHREGKRSWRCTRAEGHERRHVSMAGGRCWR